MLYLVGENVFTFNSGTEFSQFERLRALNAAGIQTRLVTRNFNRFLDRDLKKHHLTPDQVINMYDFFQEIRGRVRKEQSLRLVDDFPLTTYHINGIDNNHSTLEDFGQVVGTIHVMPATVALIGDVEYNDPRGQATLKEYWDWRGFKTMVENYHPDGQVAAQRFLRPDGTTAIEVTHMNVGGSVRPSSYKLINYNGHDHLFDSEDQLFAFFLNELERLTPGTMISDRRSVDAAVLQTPAKKKLAYLHNLPVAKAKHPASSPLLSFDAPLLAPAAGQATFDGILVPTEAEQADLMANSHVTVGEQLQVAPDTYVTAAAAPRELGTQIKVVYAGLLSEGKQLAHLLQAFAVLAAKNPTSQLVLQGYYATPKDREQVTNLLDKLALKDRVTVKDYDPDLAGLYADATIFINASTGEAFGMNMLQAMAAGVPVVSYANHYASDALLVNGENALVSKSRSPQALGNLLVQLASDPTKYATLSQGALRTAAEHNEAAFVAAWKEIL